MSEIRCTVTCSSLSFITPSIDVTSNIDHSFFLLYYILTSMLLLNVSSPCMFPPLCLDSSIFFLFLPSSRFSFLHHLSLRASCLPCHYYSYSYSSFLRPDFRSLFFMLSLLSLIIIICLPTQYPSFLPSPLFLIRTPPLSLLLFTHFYRSYFHPTLHLSYLVTFYVFYSLSPLLLLEFLPHFHRFCFFYHPSPSLSH